jgi:hypothetical protein
LAWRSWYNDVANWDYAASPGVLAPGTASTCGKRDNRQAEKPRLALTLAAAGRSLGGLGLVLEGFGLACGDVGHFLAAAQATPAG